jgi:hypothetical protein
LVVASGGKGVHRAPAQAPVAVSKFLPQIGNTPLDYFVTCTRWTGRHLELTMSAYIFASIEITDHVAYQEYRRRVPAVIAAYGGRYLARGGAVQRLEGDAPIQSNLLAIEGV